jgi:hypothetical protein
MQTLIGVERSSPGEEWTGLFWFRLVTGWPPFVKAVMNILVAIKCGEIFK